MGNASTNDLTAMDVHVGFQELQVADPELGLTFPVRVLYPTAVAGQATAVGLYQLEVAPEAAPAPGSFPVVLLSHGTGSSGLVHRQLAQALVRQGLVVALPEHPHNNRDDDSWAHTPQNLLARPRHVQLALDAVYACPTLAPVLRPAAAALLGHSLGGYTALAAVGGQPAVPPGFPQAGQPIPVPPADARARALVLLAPAVPWFQPPGSLAAVQLPTLLLMGEKDELLPPTHADIVQRGLPATAPLHLRVVPNAGHFSFLTPFPPARTSPAFPPSQDPPGFDRPQFQQELAAEIGTFLREVLPA